MVKYLQMDGVDDYITLPSITYKDIELVIELDGANDADSIRHDYANYGTGGNQVQHYRQNGNDTNNANGIRWNGIAGTKGTKIVPVNQKGTLRLVGWVDYTGPGSIFRNYINNAYYLKGKLWSIKCFNNAGALVAHYDMSTGTVQDQSGNGRHATLYGGTWLDDGTGGTPTGTDGSVSLDTKQAMYQDSTNPFDIRNILYQDGSTSSDTNQVLYQISSTSFDMLQEIFNDGQVGQTPFDMRFLLYSDGSILHDSRQTMYESGQNAFDLHQALYESGEGKADIHLVLFADSSTPHEFIQSLYEDAQVHFDTKQISFNPDQQKIGTIRLQGKRDLYVYLVAKQELNVPLKAKRELTVSLKGGVNMTMQNQNFSMCAGDTKYLTFSIEGADDLTGATITWGAKPRSYSTVENVLSKSTGNGITVENGEVKIKLDPEDTELLSGTYYHECLMEDNLQNVSTVFTGLMSVNK